MRVAALYDVHGNLPALEAVLADVALEDVDVILLGGDVIVGPMPCETLDLLLQLGDGVRFLAGNHEREVVEILAGGPDPTGLPPDWAVLQRWAAGQLTSAHREAIERFEREIVLDVDGLGPTRFCHGSPRRDDEILTSITPDDAVREACSGVREPTIVGGHTHVQFDRRAGGRRLVNAGSVGLPWERPAGAYWALLGPDVTLRRAPYDLPAAAERLTGTGCPHAAELVVAALLDPPDGDETARAFERAAGRTG